MIREIGSEFHRMNNEDGRGFKFPVEGALVFSGRTAIETVLKEVPFAKKAVLPSYCCDSMIEPFIKAGIGVEFFSVEYKDGLNIDVQIPEHADILLWCNYFGYSTPMPDMSSFKNNGGIIIEDITHSLFSSSPNSFQSDYLVASVRKWEPIYCGGYCASVGGNLKYIPMITPPDDFVKLRDSAMRLKAEYLDDLNEDKKQKFLSMFVDGNNWLSDNYSGLTVDNESVQFLESVDMEKQKQARLRNARVLYDGLRDKVDFLFPKEDMECPLFVPIVIQNRNEVRKALVENKIYCPVHWPKPVGCSSNLYELELSLICDQRYDEEDMDRIVSTLCNVI